MPWIWIAISGVITLLLGIHRRVAFASVRPFSIPWGFFLGVNLVLAGAGWVGLGLGLRQRAAA